MDAYDDPQLQGVVRPLSELAAEVFGKRVLITDREDWSLAEVVAGYRSQSDAKSGSANSRSYVVSFSPMHHWSDHNIRNIRVHVFTANSSTTSLSPWASQALGSDL